MKKIVCILVLLVVVAALASFMVLRHGRERTGKAPDSTEPAAAAGDLAPSAADVELLHDLVEHRPDRNVVVIGLDGSSWNLIGPMIDRGQLPTFKRLRESGAWGDLRSTVFQVTPPAWTAMFSGCQPWVTGIYGFGKIDTTTWTLQPVHSNDVRVPRVWDMSSQAGLKTAVINVPVTYPAHEVNGIMVSGMLTPELVLLKKITSSPGTVKDATRAEFEKLGLASYAPPRKAVLNLHNNPVTAYLLDEIDDGKDAYTTCSVTIERFSIPAPPFGGYPGDSVVVPAQTAVCSLTHNTPWMELRSEYEGVPRIGWVRMSPQLVGDRMLKMTCSPIYGNVARSNVKFCYPDSFRREIAARFERFIPFVSYVIPTIPDLVNDLAGHLDFYYHYDDWNLFVYQFQVTDVIGHWDGPDAYSQDTYMRLDSLLGDFVAGLPDNTVLIIASDHGQRGYRFKINLNAWLNQLNLLAQDLKGGLDTANSIAFHMYWGIYINRELLEKRWQSIPGFQPVEGKSLYNSFVDFLIEEAKHLTFPNTDRPIPVTIQRLPAQRVRPSPDLVVQPEYGRYAVHHEDVFHRGQDLILTPFQEGKKWSHRRAGMFLVTGPGIKRGYEAPTQDIFDITPTILYILGLPVADYFDGHIMSDLFEAEFLASNRPEHISAYQFTQMQPVDEDTDREALEEKLRAIGYIQ